MKDSVASKLERGESVQIKDAMHIPEVAEMMDKLNRGEISMCGCIGPMYGEPYCACDMERRGLPSSDEHIAAIEQSNKDLRVLFGPGGKYYEKKEEHDEQA